MRDSFPRQIDAVGVDQSALAQGERRDDGRPERVGLMQLVLGDPDAQAIARLRLGHPHDARPLRIRVVLAAQPAEREADGQSHGVVDGDPVQVAGGTRGQPLDLGLHAPRRIDATGGSG